MSAFGLPFLNHKKSYSIKGFLDLYREPVVTYCITPNNSPELQNERGGFSSGRGKFGDKKNRFKHEGDFGNDFYSHSQNSTILLNTITGMFSRFYMPERVRFHKWGIKIKLSDVVSYKIVIENGEVKYYLTVPKRWSKQFTNAIKRDWGQVDITKTEEKLIDIDVNKSRASEIFLKHHHALAIKYNKNSVEDLFHSSIASIASTMSDGDKMVLDYNIQPVNDNWKGEASKKIKSFKNGRIIPRVDMFTVNGVLGKVFDFFNVIFDEFVQMIEVSIMEVKDTERRKEEQLFSLEYSEKKIQANSSGYKVQIKSICQSEDYKKVNNMIKNMEVAFASLDGDNKYVFNHIKSKRGIKSVLKSIESNSPKLLSNSDIYCEKELNEILRLPSKDTLKEFANSIKQDNFTRTEIADVFFKNQDGAIPIAVTLEKQARNVYMGGYKRDNWTNKGRKVAEKDKTKLDDRSTATMAFGGMGSGKTTQTISQILYTFGCHIKNHEQWKTESKSVVAFDVADGEMISKIYNHVPHHLRERVVILNHSNFKNPIAVNNADLQEYNNDIMKDDDYAYTLAEMECKLVLEILKSEKTIAMDRWFTSALQVVHTINRDWGYIEAMRVLIDDDFRENEILPKIKSNKRLHLEMTAYNNMAINGDNKIILQTIQNRFSQLERDQKLWDCIAQKPLRNEDGSVKLNFRKMMDGDEDGAYLILIYIPKTGVSDIYRRFIFASYFTKVWNVLMSRESGFAGREYRPETLIVIDEIHQIIDIPVVAKLFIDIFKEPRKYSGRYWFTLHGWSSLAHAGKGLEGDIKQSIMDNGCNLIMLKGGGDAFHSLQEFLHPMTQADFNNLMQMEFCGIYAIRWNNKNHVFQAKLPINIERNPDFKKYSDNDVSFLSSYNSKFGRNRDDVRDENLERSYSMIENALMSNDEDESILGKKSIRSGGFGEKRNNMERFNREDR